MSKMPVQLEAMTANDIDDAAELVRVAMNENEATWAKQTMEFHFGCVKHKLDDGRSYLVLKRNNRIIGLVGLHRYIWGPKENVWLAWFAVDPDCRGQGLGSQLLAKAESLATDMGYSKFFVETYAAPVFDKARAFYKSKGFAEVGRVDNYLPDGSAMIVYGKELCKGNEVNETKRHFSNRS